MPRDASWYYTAIGFVIKARFDGLTRREILRNRKIQAIGNVDRAELTSLDIAQVTAMIRAACDFAYPVERLKQKRASIAQFLASNPSTDFLREVARIHCMQLLLMFRHPWLTENQISMILNTSQSAVIASQELAYYVWRELNPSLIPV